jgi:AcrR family transcriptional regulator
VTRKLRADAADNRMHIMAVARSAFAADGVELPVREIARRAGMGVATVYRHFPSRHELLMAVLTEHVTRCEADMRAALADPDPKWALRRLIVRFGERQVHDRGLNEALLSPDFPFAAQRRAQADAFAQLVRHASLRDGVDIEDARVALTAIASFRSLPTERATPAIRRLTGLLITSLIS